MNTIYKYPFAITDGQSLDLPVDADPVHVGLDPQGTPCLWCAVNTDSPIERRRLYLRGTGQRLPENPRFGTTVAYGNVLVVVGSFIQGPFVWHVFLEK